MRLSVQEYIDELQSIETRGVDQFPVFAPLSYSPGLRSSRDWKLQLEVYKSLFRSRAGAKLQLSAPTRGSRCDGLGQMVALACGAPEELYMGT